MRRTLYLVSLSALLLATAFGCALKGGANFEASLFKRAPKTSLEAKAIADVQSQVAADITLVVACRGSVDCAVQRLEAQAVAHDVAVQRINSAVLAGTAAVSGGVVAGSPVGGAAATRREN